MPQPISIHAPSTALILIDLQKLIVGRSLQPYSSASVVAHAVRLADAMLAKGGTVVLVNVDVTQILSLPADQPMRSPGSPPPAADACDLVPELGHHASDVRITKRQWGAFHGTGLDQQLRRRNIRTLLMAGIATNFGVESTARAAFDRGYALLFAEDAMASMTAEAHAFPVTQIFPRMGYVRSTQVLLEAIAASTA